jgi:hypothetical protein
MNDLMRELDRLDRATSLRNFDKRNHKRQQRKTHRIGSFLVVLLLLAGAGGVVYVATKHSHPHQPLATKAVTPIRQQANDSTSNEANAAHLAGEAPTAGVGEQHSRLLAVVAPPAGTGDYKLLNPTFGPPRYDPCRPIHYVIRDENTPAGGDDEILQAVAATSKATGLKFIYDGKTTEKPTAKRPAYLPARYGDRWAPVLIAWTSPTEIPGLKGSIDGLGGSNWYATDPAHGYAYVSGTVFLDAPQITSERSDPGGSSTTLMVAEHELGHVVGLNHVNDPTQIMYFQGNRGTAYGAGDLRGLAYEGAGACHPEV